MTLGTAAVSRPQVTDGGRDLTRGEPVSRPGICRIARPCLRQTQHAPRFFFAEASVLLIESGTIGFGENGENDGFGGFGDGIHTPIFWEAPALVVVDAGTSVDLTKHPAGPAGTFSSVFLELSQEIIREFQRPEPARLPEPRKPPRAGQPTELPAAEAAPISPPVPFAALEVDTDLHEALWRVYHGAANPLLSDARLRYRVCDLLAALTERGAILKQRLSGTADTLRELISDAPDERWTARDAGRALAISEATLRRRLAREGMRFEDLVAEVRMHHAMLLLQTTTWDISRVAAACGYRSRARFSERFRDRFGSLPSAVR